MGNFKLETTNFTPIHGKNKKHTNNSAENKSRACFTSENGSLEDLKWKKTHVP